MRHARPTGEAKSNLEEAIEAEDAAGSPPRVKHGDEQAEDIRRKGTLLEFMDRSPLRGVDLCVERHPDTIADLRIINPWNEETP